MNRIYHLVWNGALRVVQVASEFSSSKNGLAEGGVAAAPRLRPLWGAILASGLWTVGTPAMAQLCQPTDTTACSAQGGLASIDRSGSGGAGNGQGGSAIVIAGNIPLPGGLSLQGSGGDGASGVDVTTSGAGGSGGAPGTTSGLVTAGVRGGDGIDAQRAPGGGGGGGAGIFTSAPVLTFGSGTLTIGGDGGKGGNPDPSSGAGGAGGGGGGTGFAATPDGFSATVLAGATIAGGAGGAGGSGASGLTYGGSGGGGGDGMLLFGIASNIDNLGTIRGGAGGAAGAGTDTGFNGNAGGAGAGINALNTDLMVFNRGSIEGGAAVGNGPAGFGIVTRGEAELINAGTISGGQQAGGGRASAVLFNGLANTLTLQTGSLIQGALEVTDGGEALVSVEATNTINTVQLDGDGLGARITFQPGFVTSGSLLVGSITGTGDVETQGTNAAFSFDHIDVDGSVTFNHTGATGVGGTIVSTGSQTFLAPLKLLQASGLTSTNSTINVGSLIDGAETLSISTPAALTLNGAIGGVTPLTSLTTSSGTVSIKDVAAGSLDMTTTNGPITQGGVFDITGASSFDAGINNDVVLTSANTFGGNISARGRNISINSAGDLTVTSLSNASNGNISLTSGGLLDPQTPMSTSGSISLASNGGALSLGHAVLGGTVTLTSDNGITLSSLLATSGGLTLNSGGGSVFQVANAVAADVLSANVRDTLSLTSAANAINSLGDMSVGALNLTNATALNVTGDLSATSAQFDVSPGVVVTGSISTTAGTTLGASTPLTVGNGGTTGTLSGVVIDNGLLAFHRSNTASFSGALFGTGQLVQKGSGTLLFDGDGSTFAGSTLVQSGALIVGSTAGSATALAGNVDVAANAALGGHGSISGNVSMAANSVLTPGNSIGTLTVDGDLTMAQGSAMDVELGASGAGDKVVVNGSLVLNGAVVNVSNVGGMGPGVYTIFAYSNVLIETNGGLLSGSTPPGHALQLQTLLGPRLINILDVSNTTLNFWNANGLASGSQMGGGDGTWSTTSSTWTDANGSITGAMNPQPGFAVFGGSPGLVTVDGTGGQVSAEGLQFLCDGYHMAGSSVLLQSASGAPVIRVGDGSDTTAGYVATIDNVLTGTQGLTKDDAGTLVLHGANTYAGETTVNGGTLSVNDEGNLGAVANGVTLNGGALRVTGNTYASTDRALTLATGGAVDIADASNTFRWDGAIGGSGSLEKRGAGTLVLDHANAYTGRTSVTGGTLRLRDSGAIGSGALSLASGTTLDLAKDGLVLTNAATVAGTSTVNVDSANAATLTGVIADGTSAGGLTKSGAGELRLTGNNTYTGTTTIDGGTLHVGDGGTHGSVAGDIVDHGALVLDRSDDVTYAGALSGEGSLRKLGGGLLHLTGDSSAFTGATDFTAGTLQLDGKLGGDLTMASGAVLSGTGTAGSVALQSGAEVSPGGQGVPATLAFAGDLTMAAGARYTVDVTDAGQGDRLDVAGHATLQGGSVVSLGTGGNWNTSTTYTILSAASGVSGTFAGVSTNLAFLNPSLVYTANAVNLTLARNAVAFPDVAVTRNEHAAAGAIEALGTGMSVYDAILRLDAVGAREAFDSLSGEIHASTRTAIADDQRYQREAINNHLLSADTAGDGEGISAWASTWGHWGNHDSDGNAARMNANGGGLLVGADTAVGASTRLGFAVGSGQISASTPERDASSDVRTRTAGLYAGGREGAFQWQAGALYGQQKIRTHRTVTVDDLATRLSSDDDGHAAQGYVEGAYVFDGTRGSWAPFVNVAYQQLRTPTVHERGSFGALDVDSDRSSQTFGTLGLRGEAKLGDAGTALFGSVGWRHASGDVDSASRMRFAGGGAAFDIQGVPIADNAGVVSAGLRFRPSPSVTIDATYSGQFASDAKDQSARLSLNWSF